MDAPYRIRQLLGWLVLQQISRRSRFQGASQVAGARKRGKDDGPCGGALALQFRRYIQSAHFRHFYVGYQNVRLLGGHRIKSLLAIVRLANHHDIVFDTKQRGQRSQHHSLIFRQYYPDRIHASPLRFAALSGSRMVNRVPALVSRSRVPPSASTRSRIPRTPLPSVCLPPRPSSWISSLQWPSTCSNLRWHRSAWACRTTLVTDSRTASASTVSWAGESRTGVVWHSAVTPAVFSVETARTNSSSSPPAR